MRKIEIKVESDHIERMTAAKPLAAISELIWNSYDADAKNVRVELVVGPLTKLEVIRVIDDGCGIKLDQIDNYFDTLGGSWKTRTPKTAAGRIIHGKKGQGRFKAFSLGNTVSWISNDGKARFTISGRRSNLKEFTISDSYITSDEGCIVEITDVIKDFEIWSKDGFCDKIREVFALQLYQDPSFHIVYDGIQIDAKDAINNVSEYSLDVDCGKGVSITGQLDVVDWKNQVDRKLMLCLPGKFSFHEMPPGIQARGFVFTAYLTSDYFQEMADQNTTGVVELDAKANLLIESAKSKLRDHFGAKEADRSREKVEGWKKARIYPYQGDITDSIDRNERQIFDVIALNISDYSSDFDSSSMKQKKFIFQLLRSAIESSPSAITSILEQVIDLPQERQDDLALLLNKTSLTAVINSAKSVTDRLDFIKALQILIFDPKSKKQLLERSQLHRIIAGETWLFGEQFSLINDDEDLTSVLRSHLRLLNEGRINLAPDGPVLDANGDAAIVDLMLSCRVPMATDNQRSHLVIELKRPTQTINEDVINQIKKYAKAVALDERFKHTSVEWDFVAISNSMTRDAELETRQSGKPRGLIFELDEPKMRVWAKTWGQIIEESEGRLTFFKRQLEYQANDREAIRYLEKINPDYLSKEVKDRIDNVDNKKTGGVS